MIDFDLRYSLKIEEKDKEIINNLLKVQMCIFGLNYNLVKSDKPDKKTFFDLYKESFDYILEETIVTIVKEFLVKIKHFKFLYTIVHYSSLGQYEKGKNTIININNFINLLKNIRMDYMDLPSSQFGRTDVMNAPMKPVKYEPQEGKNTELKTNPELDKPPVDEIPGYKLPKYCSGLPKPNGNWFGLDDIKWSFRPSSKDDVASYDDSLELELDSLNQEMFSDQKMIVMGTETRK